MTENTTGNITGITIPAIAQQAHYDNITQIHFCPVCHNLMRFKEKGSILEWSCPVCDFNEAFTASKIVISEADQYRPVDYSLYKYDQSLKRCHGYCPVCQGIQELCVFYYKSDSMKNGYICTSCGLFFENEEHN